MSTLTLREYWKFFCDAWKLFKKYQDVSGDEEWQRLVQDATTIREHYPGNFAKKVLMEILEELDRKTENGGRR